MKTVAPTLPFVQHGDSIIPRKRMNTMCSSAQKVITKTRGRMSNSFHSQRVAPGACMLIKENSLIRKQRAMMMPCTHVACICVCYCDVQTQCHISLEKSYIFPVNDYNQLKQNYKSNISILCNLQIAARTCLLCHFMIENFSITPCVFHLNSIDVRTLYNLLHINLSPLLSYQ